MQSISTLLERLNLFCKFITFRHLYMFYYVYILQSIKYKKLYISFSSDLKQRVKSHNAGESPATKPYIPYRLIFYEAFLHKQDDKKREEYLKGGYGLRSIKTMLKHYFVKGKTYTGYF